MSESNKSLNKPSINKKYDASFDLTDDYKNSLPDVQNADQDDIIGANVPISRVGISNFKLPLKYKNRAGDNVTLETTVSGTVSLNANRKGINMSRIIRSFYDYENNLFSLDTICQILINYKEILNSKEAQIRLDFNYPIRQQSLRSKLEGWQYYQAAYEGILDRDDNYRKFLHFDFIYSSACPCSSELSEHARKERNVFAIPHSQRSIARISLEINSSKEFYLEDIHELVLDALKTETQVMVKREDEQAFAELNGSYPKFVEDATRLLYEKLIKEESLVDFQVTCAHLESLHSHNAIAIINKGMPNGFNGQVQDFSFFKL